MNVELGFHHSNMHIHSPFFLSETVMPEQLLQKYRCFVYPFGIFLLLQDRFWISFMILDTLFSGQILRSVTTKSWTNIASVLCFYSKIVTKRLFQAHVMAWECVGHISLLSRPFLTIKAFMCNETSAKMWWTTCHCCSIISIFRQKR